MLKIFLKHQIYFLCEEGRCCHTRVGTTLCLAQGEEEEVARLDSLLCPRANRRLPDSAGTTFVANMFVGVEPKGMDRGKNFVPIARLCTGLGTRLQCSVLLKAPSLPSRMLHLTCCDSL